MDNSVLYVLTPNGERIPAKTNEAGELIVNATATIGTDVQIRDSDGNKITSDNTTGNVRVNLRNTIGNPIEADPDGNSSSVIPTKVVDPDGNQALKNVGTNSAYAIPIQMKDNSGDPMVSAPDDNAASVLGVKVVDRDGNNIAQAPNAGSDYVIPVALKDTSGGNVTGANNDPSNTSVNVKLLSAENKLLGQFDGGTDMQPLVVGDPNGNPIITGKTNGQSDAIDWIFVNGKLRPTIDEQTLGAGVGYVNNSTLNAFLGLLATYAPNYNPSGYGGDTTVFRKIKQLFVANEQLVGGTNSGAIDLYFVKSGSLCDTYFSGLAVPDEVDLSSNFASIDGLVDVISGVAASNVGQLSVYKCYPEFNVTASDDIKVYIAAAEANKTYNPNWLAKFSYDLEAGAANGLT